MNDLYRSQFRLPWPLYEALQQSADKKGISLNAELVIRLQNSIALDHDDALALTAIAAELKQQRELIDKIEKNTRGGKH